MRPLRLWIPSLLAVLALPSLAAAQDAAPSPARRWDPNQAAADCARAFAAGLSPCDKARKRFAVVRKSARNLALCEGARLVSSFEVGLGFTPEGDKEREGDGRTPEGVFYVARRIPASSFYRAFLISYPDAADAERGLRLGLIGRGERDRILAAQKACELPPQHTRLGGMIEVHGKGGGSDWTLDCVGLEDAAVDRLWAALPAGATVVVLP
jgi:murein L,D-transpeptidase YafK